MPIAMKRRSRLRWYLRMFYEFARISLKNQLEYRANFFSGVMVESAWMCIKMTYLIVVVTAGVDINGLTPDMMKLFIGAYMFMTGIAMLLSGVCRLAGKVMNGELDLLMVKPGSLQFMQTMGSFDFAMALPNCACGAAVIAWGWGSAGLPLGGAIMGGFLFFMTCGIFMTYGFILIPQTLSFWVSSFGGVHSVFWALWDYNNMPMYIYPKAIRDIGTFAIPVFVITNWAGLFALGRLTVFQAAWGIAAPVLTLLSAHLLWKFGLRRYSSANG